MPPRRNTTVGAVGAPAFTMPTLTMAAQVACPTCHVMNDPANLTCTDCGNSMTATAGTAPRTAAAGPNVLDAVKKFFGWIWGWLKWLLLIAFVLLACGLITAVFMNGGTGEKPLSIPQILATQTAISDPNSTGVTVTPATEIPVVTPVPGVKPYLPGDKITLPLCGLTVVVPDVKETTETTYTAPNGCQITVRWEVVK